MNPDTAGSSGQNFPTFKPAIPKFTGAGLVSRLLLVIAILAHRRERGPRAWHVLCHSGQGLQS